MELGAVVKEQYRVIEHIGRGGMADVWSARDLRLRRMVAIKTIAAGLSADVDPVALFEKEAQTIAQMEHPHILPIYDFGEYEHSLYIVMRYVTGGSLEHLLRQGPMSPEDVLRMGDSIGRALDHAHGNNVIHLDLKPPNILLDSSQVPYLADFGLATVLDPEGRARNPGSGTLLYMAPEQLVSEVIDHRADIYSFSIMLFHMLTGRLPFDGSAPLAIRQIQANEGLPDLERYVQGLPAELSALLRSGTAADPGHRPVTHAEIMDQFRAIVQPGVVTVSGTAADTIAPIGSDYFIETQRIESSDSALLEAVDLYSRARYDWQGGQGRFLLGVTHFMLMSDYYQNADYYNLTIDAAGYQMLLRGALEYDYELDYWWKLVSPDNQRWVCLHTLRSGNSPARIRALHCLETLPDQDDTPVIPRLVGQALEIEADPGAKMAALKLFGTRSKLLQHPTPSVKTEKRGRLLTTFSRFNLQMNVPAAWQDVIYSQEVDTLIAETAFDTNQEVAEYAARTVGRIRSLVAVRHLSDEQMNNRPGALQALAFIRDESPALPDIVSPQARFYAWIANTVRRLTDDSLQLIWRFVMMLLGGWLAMGEQVYNLFRSQQLFTAQRWANTIAMGLVFGLLIAITHLFADEMSRRLRGFWHWWMRLLLSGLLGYLMATLSYGGFRWLFIQDPAIMWDLMRVTGFSLALALAGTAMLQLSGWQGVILTTVLGFLPIMASHHAFYFQQEFTIVPAAPIALIVGVLFGARAAQIAPFGADSGFAANRVLRPVIGVMLGLAWMALAWLYFASLLGQLIAGQLFTWDTVLLVVVVCFVSAMLISYWLKGSGRIAFVLTALVAFVAIYAMVAWQFFDFRYQVPLVYPDFHVTFYDGVALRPITDQPVFNYDFAPPEEVYFVSLPLFVVLALGANWFHLLEGWLGWIGKPATNHERGGWLTGGLLYTLMASALVSVLALFSLKVSIPWALGWSLWGFLTFVFALAAYRWAKWGARALVVSGVVLVLGGFLFDYVNMRFMASQMLVPALLQTIRIDLSVLQWSVNLQLNALTFWAGWAVVVGIFTWGAYRQRLWGGIGLVAMLVAWHIVAIFSSIQGSMAVFALTSCAFVLYTLAPKYALMESRRLSLPIQRLRQAVPEVTAPPTQVGWMPYRQIVEEALEVASITVPDEQPAIDTVFSPASDLMTEYAPAQQSVPDSEPALASTEDDIKVSDRSWQGLVTEMDASAAISAEGERPYSSTPKSRDEQGMQTEMDPGAKSGTEGERPRLRLNTAALKSRDEQGMQTEMDPGAKSGTEGERPRLRLNTAALKSRDGQGMQTEMDPGAKSGTEGERPRLRLNTAALKSRDGQGMQTEMDPGAKSGTEGERPRLRLNTAALKGQLEPSANPDTAADPQEPPQAAADEPEKPEE
jgi:serine/threonine protein kinase